MNIHTKIFILCIFQILLTSIWLHSPAIIHAQSGSVTSSLSITPPLSEIIIKPGKSITQAFTIKNEGSVDLEVTPTLVDFSPDDKTGAPIVLPNNDNNNDNFPFAKLENLDKQLGRSFLLPVGISQQLVLRITIPSSELERDYYKTLLIKSAPSGLLQTSGTTTVSQAYVGVHMLISVSNSGIDRGKIVIEQFTAPRIVDMFSSLPLKVVVKNVGKNYTSVHGEIKISSMLGKVVKIFPILPENVLAGSIRELHGSQQDPDDTKSAIATNLEYRPVFLLGKYDVNIKVGTELQTPQNEEVLAVYALPLSPLCVLVLIWGGRKAARYFRTKYETI